MPDIQKSLPEMIWDDLNKQIATIKAEINTLQTRTERSETAGGHPSATLANAPLVISGAKVGDELFITNARKTGEGAGLGTGLIAYYNSSTDSWFRPSDDTAVVI